MKAGDLVKYELPIPKELEDYIGIIIDMKTDWSDEEKLLPDEDLFLVSWRGLHEWVYGYNLEVISESR